jgi:hypothetical protein
MFDNLLSHALLLYTSIRAKTYTLRDENMLEVKENEEE